MRPSDAGPVAPERPRRLRKDSGTFDIGIFVEPPWPDVNNRKRDRLQHRSARPKCRRCASEIVLRRQRHSAGDGLAGALHHERQRHNMGLTIHYQPAAAEQSEMRVHLPDVNEPNCDEAAHDDGNGKHSEHEFRSPAPFKRVASHVGLMAERQILCDTVNVGWSEP